MDPDRAVARITRLTAGLIAAGAAVYFALSGWRGGGGFLLGGAASWISFLWLKRIVYSLGESVRSQASAREHGGIFRATLFPARPGGLCYSEVFRNQLDSRFDRFVCARRGCGAGNPDRTDLCRNMNLG